MAGPVGTLALEVATYADMLVRGRAASDQPKRLGEALRDQLSLDLGKDETGENRSQALGALVGYLDGPVLGAAYALIRGSSHGPIGHLAGSAALTVGAVIGSNGLPAALGVTDPSEWSKDDWVTDLVPHAIYGITTAFIYELIRPD